MIIVNKSSVRKMEGTKVTFYSMLFCAAFFLLRALSRDSFTPAMTFGTGINILLFALVSTVISLITLVNAIKLIGSTPTAVMGSLEPWWRSSSASPSQRTTDRPAGHRHPADNRRRNAHDTLRTRRRSNEKHPVHPQEIDRQPPGNVPPDMPMSFFGK